jgi:hypothetical protein
MFLFLSVNTSCRMPKNIHLNPWNYFFCHFHATSHKAFNWKVDFCLATLCPCKYWTDMEGESIDPCVSDVRRSSFWQKLKWRWRFLMNWNHGLLMIGILFPGRERWENKNVLRVESQFKVPWSKRYTHLCWFFQAKPHVNNV